MLGTEHGTAWTALALVALAATAGCLGLGPDDPDAEASATDASGSDQEASTPGGGTVEPTAATKALWEKGHKDPYLDAEATGAVREFEFWVEAGTMRPYDDLEIGALTFSKSPDEPGQVPAPEIRVRQGDTVRVTLHGAPHHTMHWHGIDVPWRSDGVPFVTQDMGDDAEDTYTYEFVARQPGTYWYHCVVDFPAHVDFGMFGPLIVEPRDGPELPYDREETLMFHEVDSQMFAWREQDDGGKPSKDRIHENPVDAAESGKQQARTIADIGGLVAEDATGADTWSEGPRPYYPLGSLRYEPQYDTFMINGKSYPETEPVEIREGETLRLRLINAGQLHKSIHLHGHHVLVTHKDGYKLDDPYWADTVDLAPGARKDVYVQGTNPGIWKLHDHSGASGMGSTNAHDHAFPGGMITALRYVGFEPPQGLPAGADEAGDLALFADGGDGGR